MPPSAEYWHIGATAIRFRSVRLRSWSGSNSRGSCDGWAAPVCSTSSTTPSPPGPSAAADWAYVRFHGPDALNVKYWGLYGGDRLEQSARRLDEWLGKGCDVYAYFNNDDSGFAVDDARWLAGRLGHQPAEVAGNH